MSKSDDWLSHSLKSQELRKRKLIIPNSIAKFLKTEKQKIQSERVGFSSYFFPRWRLERDKRGLCTFRNCRALLWLYQSG